MNDATNFEVFTYDALYSDADAPIATFSDRAEAFDYARQFAIEQKRNMLVRGPAPEPEAEDVRF